MLIKSESSHLKSGNLGLQNSGRDLYVRDHNVVKLVTEKICIPSLCTNENVSGKTVKFQKFHSNAPHGQKSV